MNRITIFLAIAFVLLWNSGFIGAEYGLPYTGPYTFIFWRYLALTITLTIYLLLRNRLLWMGRRVVLQNILVGILAHGVMLLCILLALEQGVPSGIVALVLALQPMATGAFAGMVTGEQTPLSGWIGLIIGFVGVAITVIERIDFSDMKSVFGFLIPLGSVVAITAASLIQRRAELNQKQQKPPMDLALFYQSLGTLIVLTFPAIFYENLETEWSIEFIYTMLWLIFAVSLGAYVFMWMLIRRIDATKVASLFYLGPPVTMGMAWMAFGDKPTLMDIVGMVVVLIGVFLTQFRYTEFIKSVFGYGEKD